jgi:UDP-N-acetylglucosamine--N-acetylmuramyl-(pentapeptide) pyrophosphoryl-undecaprenol N-acetylglucosamine transferase
VTGRPLPLLSRPVPGAEARRSLDLPAEGPVLGVFGALAGARSLNELALSAWAESGPPVLHLTGQRDFEELAGRDRRTDYLLLPSVERFGAALSAVDLAVSRAGGTVWELAAAGVPAILVPYPHATGDHQTLNARHFESAGGAVLVPEGRLEEVPGLVDELLTAPDRLRQMREAMLGLARPGAAAEIAEELVALARGGC